MTAYFVVSFALSSVRFTGLRIQTWDIGIFEQSFWSFAHGHGFYNAANAEFEVTPSFLGVHPAFLMYPLGYLYGLAPSVETLFVLQSAAVALAAVPLYFLASGLSGSRWKGLLCGGMFLLWAPTLAGNLFDFHLEALLPLSIFTLVVLWTRHRYLLASIPAIVACATLEVGPFLVAAAGLFFLLETFYQSRPKSSTAAPAPWSRARSTLRRIGVGLRNPPTLFGLVCLIGGIAAYVALRFLETNVFGGAAVLAAGAGAFPSLLDPLRYGFGGLLVDVHSLTRNLFPWLSYWVLIYALVAFIPLLAFRTIVLALPWIGFTLITEHGNYFLLGNQYGFVAAIGVFIGFAYGISSVHFSSIRETAKAIWERGTAYPRDAPVGVSAAVSVGSDAQGARAGSSNPSEAVDQSYLRTPRTSASLWTAAILVALALNVALSPMDPLLAGAPLGAGYNLNYTTPAEYRTITEMAGLIPSGSSVVATSDLFPYVANNVNAATTGESTSQGVLSHFPYSATNLPRFVFASQFWYDLLPPWLRPMVWNQSDYGARAVLGQGDHGWVFLFEQGYRGSTLDFSISSFPALALFDSLYWMNPGPAGTYEVDPAAYSNASINDSTGTTGRVWGGPGVLVPGGNYTFYAFIRIWKLNSSAALSNSTPLLTLYVSTLGRPTYCPTIVTLSSFAEFQNWSLTNVQVEPWYEIPVSPCISAAGGFPYLTPEFQLVGVLDTAQVGVALDFVWVVADPTG